MTVASALALVQADVAAELAQANASVLRAQQNKDQGQEYQAIEWLYAATKTSDDLAVLTAAINAPAPTTLTGLWNNGTPAAALGNPSVEVVLDYADSTNNLTYGYDAARIAQQAGKRLMLSVGNCSAAQATAIAQTLVANGQGSAIIRPMWEMNQDIAGWFGAWNQSAMSADQYVAAWDVIYKAFKAVSASFEFFWCPNAGSGNEAAGRLWNDTYPWGQCQLIGCDIYDTYPSVAAAQTALGVVTAFAKSVGVPWGLGEWGLANNVDDPAFVQMIQAACATCAVQVLFSEVGNITGPGTDITKAPNSLAAYKAWLG